jgi:hypothetical protein
MPTITVSTNYTLLLTDDVILVDSTGGPITITLPAAAPTGQRYYIKDKFGTTDTNPIVVSATPNQIDNASSFMLTVEKQSVMAHCYLSDWFIL